MGISYIHLKIQIRKDITFGKFPIPCPTFVICNSSVVTARNASTKFPREFFSCNNLV